MKDRAESTSGKMLYENTNELFPDPNMSTTTEADALSDTNQAQETVESNAALVESPKSVSSAIIPIAWHTSTSNYAHSDIATSSIAENTDMLDENGHKYVGLTNQAMTCYLNSLIQSLYMIPEFRNVIFKIERKPSARDIQFQLQKLFVQLQTSDKCSLPTVDLTSSFGWENEGLYQHDVQELFRLMIEAIEKKWANTEHKGCIENLYKGDIVDYVKCMRCKTVKPKNDMFLDLSLAVKSDGAFLPHKSLEEAISAFTKPEMLNGNNKYRCDTCNSLEDAEKGLRITEFPYLLAIQLKRFGFDYNTFHRVKLNDRLAFPDYLDLNPYVYKEPAPEKPKLSYAEAAKRPPSQPKEEKPKPVPEESVWLKELPDSEPVKEMLKQGKYIYELFSVMVHQGSATGGHYYAYIKNMDQQRWFCFNDSSVTKATVEDVQQTFGGSTHFGLNSTNAYMLMYRRVDYERNQNFPRTPDLPEHMKKMLEAMLEEERQLALQREQEKSMVVVHVVCNDRSTIGTASHELFLHKDLSYEELRSRLCKEYPHINEEDTRVIQCNQLWAMCELLPGYQDEPPLCTPYRRNSGRVSFKTEIYLMLDTKEGAEFQPFPKNDQTPITADVFICNIDTEEVIAAKRVCVAHDASVSDMKIAFLAIPEIRESDYPNVRIAYDQYQDDNRSAVLWEDDTAEVRSVVRRISENISIYADVGSPKSLEADRQLPYEDSIMYQILEKKKFGMKLRIALPPTSEYYRVALAPPDSRTGLRSPVPSPFYQLRSDLKPITSDNSASSSSIESNDAFFNNHDQIPVDPFQTTILPETVSNSLSATSTYSSTPSGTMPNVQVITSAPLDPQQMEDLIRTSTSVPDNPPPSYEQMVRADESMDEGEPQIPIEPQPSCSIPPLEFDNDVVMGTSPYNIEQGYTQLENEECTELSGTLNREDDMDSVGYHSNTPKCSPNVSDAEDFQQGRGNYSPHSENGKRRRKMENSLHQTWSINAINRSGELEPVLPLSEEEGKEMDDVFDSTMYNKRTNYSVTVLPSESDDCLYVEVDRRQPLGDFQKWMAQYLSVKESNICFLKHFREDGDGFLLNTSPLTAPLRDIFSELHKISVRLQVTAREDENVVNIHMFHFQEPNVDKWPVLFNLAIASDCEVSALLFKCQALLKDIYSEEYPIERLRLRKVTVDSAELMRNDASIPQTSSYSSDTYYLQAVDDSVCSFELLKDPERVFVSVIARRYCPSKFEVLPMFEVFVEEGDNFGERLRTALSEKSGIPTQRLAVSSPLPEDRDRDPRFPYNRPVLDLVDKRISFTSKFDKIQQFNGKLVYFLDVAEPVKEATDEERRYIRNKDQREAQLLQNSTYRRVAERPLRIQVASESEP
ncbi:hypothetical protein M3Y94_01127100 [Aphelenchoides besseyi]|nr:hypothetical protein M3Y94_01127100 [Aphelenchoides besseyi]